MCLTPWTTQTMEFSRLEFWSEEPFPSPGKLLNPGIEPRSPALQADSLLAELCIWRTRSKWNKYTDKASYIHVLCLCVFSHLIPSVLVIEKVERNVHQQLFFWYLSGHKKHITESFKEIVLIGVPDHFLQPNQVWYLDKVRVSLSTCGWLFNFNLKPVGSSLLNSSVRNHLVLYWLSLRKLWENANLNWERLFLIFLIK